MILMTLICQPTVYGAWTAVIFLIALLLRVVIILKAHFGSNMSTQKKTWLCWARIS